jgi:hypothetical protein
VSHPDASPLARGLSLEWTVNHWCDAQNYLCLFWLFPPIQLEGNGVDYAEAGPGNSVCCESKTSQGIRWVIYWFGIMEIPGRLYLLHKNSSVTMHPIYCLVHPVCLFVQHLKAMWQVSVCLNTWYDLLIWEAKVWIVHSVNILDYCVPERKLFSWKETCCSNDSVVSG